MSRVSSFTLHCGIILSVCCCFTAEGFSKAEDWQDTQGTKFHGEPTELLGPIAVFRTSRNTGHRVALQLLSPADCVRLHSGLENRPPRAEKWADAKGETTHELIGRAMRIENGQVLPVDFTTRAEPAVVMVFYVDNGETESWEMLRQATAPFTKLRKDFPGLIDGVMYGIRHTKAEHVNMAINLKAPWLITDYYEQVALDSLNRFLPDAYSIMVLSREGVPLFSVFKPDEAAVTRLFSDVAGLLDLANPENPKGWSARGYYWSVVQPVLFAKGHADPVLVGNPLAARGLVQRKVFRFDAEIKVRADGKVTDVKVLATDLLPEKMVVPITDALAKAVFVPAVQDGAFVDGLYLYHFRAPL